MKSLTNKNKASQWWLSLDNSTKRNIEYLCFGYGNPFEDNTLTENDIIRMYQHHQNNKK
jgi:hypothetical protein